MKFTLIFKTPNVIDDAFFNCPDINQIESDESMSDEEFEKLRDLFEQQVKEFIQNDETVKIEFDTINGTKTVLPTDPTLEIPAAEPQIEYVTGNAGFAELSAALRGIEFVKPEDDRTVNVYQYQLHNLVKAFGVETYTAAMEKARTK